jgi:hypothetical protein
MVAWSCRSRVSGRARRGGVRRRDAGRAQVHLRLRSGLALDRRQCGLAFFAYRTNYLIDLEHAVIMDVEATIAVRQAEVTAQRVLLDRTQHRLGIWPERLAGDTGYASAEDLAWLVHEKGIEPYIPVFDKDRTDGGFARSDFTYDHMPGQLHLPGRQGAPAILARRPCRQSSAGGR